MPQVQRSFNKHVDAFINTVLDPDNALLVGYPGNTYSTQVSPQKISIQPLEGELYSEDGDVSLYVTDNPEVPVAFSNRASVTYASQNSPAWSITQLIEVTTTKSLPVVYPISFTNEFALFAAPVSFTNAVSPLTGYHVAVTTNPMSVNISFPVGNMGKIEYWHRNTAGAYVEQHTDLLMSDNNKQIQIPVNSTAFGFIITLTHTSVARFVFSSNGGGTHGMTFGNHSSFCRKYPIPDLASMKIERARLLGAKTWIKYLGNDMNNGGRMVAAQMPPGTFPTQYRGATLGDQIVSSKVKGLYDGAFKDGCVSRFVAPTPQDYELNAPPSLFGANGILVHNWNSDSVNQQRYRITVDIALEYTSPLTFIARQMPAFARPGELATAIELLNKMQVITENPNHDLVTRLWDKLKHAASAVAASPKVWYTIAEVGGAALALL